MCDLSVTRLIVGLRGSRGARGKLCGGAWLGLLAQLILEHFSRVFEIAVVGFGGTELLFVPRNRRLYP